MCAPVERGAECGQGGERKVASAKIFVKICGELFIALVTFYNSKPSGPSQDHFHFVCARIILLTLQNLCQTKPKLHTSTHSLTKIQLRTKQESNFNGIHFQVSFTNVISLRWHVWSA